MSFSKIVYQVKQQIYLPKVNYLWNQPKLALFQSKHPALIETLSGLQIWMKMEYNGNKYWKKTIDNIRFFISKRTKMVLKEGTI